MLIKKVLLGILVTVSSFTNGQTKNDRCLTNFVRESKISNDPSILLEYQKIEEFTKNWINENKHLNKNNSTVLLPVVVHVIWRLEEENISDGQIISQIDVLNEDYRMLNSNFGDTPAEFQNLAADVEIEFRLAVQDPDGNSTNGITRTQTNFDNIAEGTEYYQTELGGKDPWDQDSYINIWVCDIGEDGTLGFATIPSDNDPGDGIVISSQFFGNVGTASNSIPNHLGRTATHEMGHYFNLEHIWGTNETGCDDDDFVDDTPKQDYSSEGCYSFPVFDNCTFGADGIMFMNYMDYSDDECMTMFSNGQKLRMLAALNGPRAGLLTSNGLSDVTSVKQNTVMENVVSYYPNPANNILRIASNSRKNIGIKIFNVLGEVVYSNKNINSNSELNISKINSGVYFVESNISGLINFKKILISK